MTQTKTHRARIATMAVVLAAITAAAGAGLVFSLRAAPASSAVTDSTEFAGEWSPSATGAHGKLQEIASFVQGRYLRPGTVKTNLTDVSFRQLRAGDAAVKRFVIVHLANGGQMEQVPASRTAVFSACGPNPDCSVPGDAAVATQLAQRQSLELALRALRAVDTLDLVLVEMPGALPQMGRIMVFYRRSDLARALERPLRSTLPLNPPPRDADTNPVEKKSLAALVVNYAFSTQRPDTDRQHAFVLLPAAEMKS